MPNTRGDLEPATVINNTTGEQVFCMFNPHEYTVSKQNTWERKDVKGKNVPKVKFKQGGAQSLRLQLFFDTYADRSDVREHTTGLWNMMMVTEDKKNPRNNKSEPPRVEFRWGRFSFQAVITDMNQKFTLFLKDGTPVRTTVDVTFQQVDDPDEHGRQNPTSGGGAARKTHIVAAGERLDLIAAQEYGDSIYWRLIARENGIFHPLRLYEGQQLVIPPLE